MAEKLILGLRVGEEVSPLREKIERSKLLTDPNIEVRERSIEFIYVTLHECLGVELPLGLVSAMSFDKPNFRWRQLYHPNALSAIFIGGAADEANEGVGGLTQAQGIIEAASYVPQKQTRIHANDLVLSGVVDDSKGSKRILAVSYNLERKYAERVLVSLAEVPELELFDKSREGEYRGSFTKFPTGLNPIYSPLLIATAGMVEQTQHRLAIGGFVYPVYPELGMRISGDFTASMVGFKVRTDNEVNYLGFKQDWEVGYPATL